MGSMFADSDFQDTVETQLTFGTASLLGIFFGLVMVCGIFFGFGYSLGRRNGYLASSAAAAPTRMTPAAAQQTVPPQPERSPAMLTPASPSTDDLNIAAAPAAGQMTLPPITTAGAGRPPLLPVESHADARKASAVAASALSAAQNASPDSSARIPKPSAIQPTFEQTEAQMPQIHAAPGPQFTAKDLPNPYFVWTPPFDVRRRHGVTHRVFAPVSHTPASRTLTFTGQSDPPLAHLSPLRPTLSGQAMVVQIAAMSRADDAEVLASALRQRGFAPSIKSGAEDALYHVQVGPFRRDIAFATRQRLLAKGYNATLK